MRELDEKCGAALRIARGARTLLLAMGAHSIARTNGMNMRRRCTDVYEDRGAFVMVLLCNKLEYI
jgi:hypothetical protein